MFEKFFGKKTAPAEPGAPAGAALKEILALAAGEVGTTGAAVDLLYCLAAYAGHASQQVGLALVELRGGSAAPPDFNIVRTSDGSYYLFGDGIHRHLLSESPLGPYWHIARSTQPPLGLDDYKAMAGRSAGTVGGREFGVPDVPPGSRPSLALEAAALKFSGMMPPVLRRHEPAMERWPSILGEACAAEIGRLDSNGSMSRKVGARLAALALICGSHVYKPSPRENRG